MELWHQVSDAMDLPRVERLVAKNQNEMETELNSFVQYLSDFVNQNISKFGHRHRLTLLEARMATIQNTCTQVRETTQVMSGWMDKVAQQLVFVRSDQKQEADRVARYATF